MDFEAIRAMPLGEALRTVVVEGGATVGGFAGAGVLGRQIQNRITPDSAIVTLGDKLKAWGANNLPKIGVWYILRGRPLFGPTTTPLVELGIVTSVAFDTLMRLFNDGRNPATAVISGYEVMGEPVKMGEMTGADAGTVSRLIHENAGLREQNAQLKAQQTPMDPRLPPYVGGQSGQVIPPDIRERKYAFMQPAIPGMPRPPGVAEREKRYGFAGEGGMAAVSGKPGAAYVQAGKMFGMQ